MSVLCETMAYTQPVALPIPEEVLRLDVPLEAQDTSYLADSASIFSLVRTFSFMDPI